MPSTRFPHLEGVGVEKGPAESLQSSAAQPPNLRVPAWQPWAAPSRIEQLELCQNKALRVVTGQLKSTPVETLLREARICSIATVSKRATALAYEKAQRLPLDHPRRQILAAPSRHRLKRPSWRSAAQASTNRSWLTGLPLTPPSPALGKTQATGVYTLTT